MKAKSPPKKKAPSIATVKLHASSIAALADAIRAPAPAVPKLAIAKQNSLFTKLDTKGNALPDSTPNTSPEWAGVRINTGPYAGMTVAKIAPKKASQPDLLKWASSLDHMGFKDWQLIGRLEALCSIWDATKYNPAYDANFWGWLPKNDWYWTRDALAGSSASAWYVLFSDGYSVNFLRYSLGFGLAVRGLPRQS